MADETRTEIGDSSQPIMSFGPSVLSYLRQISEGNLSLSLEQALELGTNHEPSSFELKKTLEYFASPAASGQAPPSLESLDKTKPMSWYFISTSHNTYLSGNQLYGAASGSAYEHVLLRGCRSVEIDVWDGEEHKSERSEHERLRARIASHLHRRSPSRGRTEDEPATHETDGSGVSDTITVNPSRAEPRVLHGHTLTKEVPFRDVCLSIRNAAFKTSDLPIIVSLEVHAGPEQQAIMVEIMQECWKDMLIQIDTENCRVLPSPDSLRGKILVKVKAAPHPPSNTSEELSAEAAKLKLEETDSSQSGSEDEKTLQHKLTNSSISSITEVEKKKKKKKGGIIAALGALGKYTQAYHFKDLRAPEAVIPTHVFSLSEKKLRAVHARPGPSIFSHNKNFLMRAFPLGTRIGSSNLDPSILWRKGVQMVALNWQSCDAAMMMNEAQFADTDGWLLKPKGYQGSPTGEKQIGTESQLDAMPRSKIQLSIELLAAQHLPTKKSNHPLVYLKSELHVEKASEANSMPEQKVDYDGDTSGYKYRSRTLKGIDPDFMGELIRFPEVSAVEELSFIRFKIMHDILGPDELLAWSCIRLDRLRTGYRLLDLLDSAGARSGAALLVRIQKVVL